MRIGFVVSEFPLLSETFVISQMEGLASRGFEIDVICDRLGDSHSVETRGQILSLIERSHLWWRPAGLLRGLLSRLSYALSYKLAAALDLAFAGKLNKYDILIAHFGKNGSRVARARQWGRTCTPLITIFHGYDVGIPFRDNGCREYEVLFRHGDLHLTVNNVFRQMLIQSGADAEKTLVHRMGVDVATIPFTPRSRSRKKVLFVSVCRMVEKKGIEFALKAFAEKKVATKDWHYDIIGDGPLQEGLQTLAARLGISDRVTFVGSLSHDEVKARLRYYDAFILPSVTSSLGDMEGIPVALMEAMASGLPVISSRHSGIPELITDGETGFLAPERDFKDLAERILKVITDPALCDRIAVAARDKIEADHDNTALHDRMAAIVFDLAKSQYGSCKVGNRRDVS